jgi:tetratricopeptide (TPR) repeat protein
MNTVRACVLPPKPAADPAELVRRAEQVLAANRVNWYCYVAGLAQYRAGQYEQAVERFREALTVDPNWRARAINYPGLAMAYHHLGRVDEARGALAAAEKAIDGLTEVMARGPVGTMPIPWFDWLECRYLYREAKLLLTGSPPPDDPRLRLIQERALSALSSKD